MAPFEIDADAGGADSDSRTERQSTATVDARELEAAHPWIPGDRSAPSTGRTVERITETNPQITL